MRTRGVVEVEVDEPRREELAGRIDALGPGRDLDVARRSDALDPVPPDEDGRVLVNGARAVENRASLDRQPPFLGLK